MVTDQGLIDAGILAGFFTSLEQAGIDYQLFCAVEAKPSTDVLDAAVALLKASTCTAVIGVGGGSSIYTAKGVAAMATNPGNSSPSRPPPVPAVNARRRPCSPTSARCSRR